MRRDANGLPELGVSASTLGVWSCNSIGGISGSSGKCVFFPSGLSAILSRHLAIAASVQRLPGGEMGVAVTDIAISPLRVGASVKRSPVQTVQPFPLRGLLARERGFSRISIAQGIYCYRLAIKVRIPSGTGPDGILTQALPFLDPQCRSRWPPLSRAACNANHQDRQEYPNRASQWSTSREIRPRSGPCPDAR
jgi:hypothetical protein